MTGALLAFAAAMVVLHVVSVALVLARVRATAAPPPAPDAPHVTLLRPVCGVDPFDAETLASSFAQDWPSYDVVFCAARADDPAVALVRGLIAAHPGVRARLLVGDDRISTNPKLNNLEKGWRVIEADWVAMADSNLMLPPDYLRRIMALRGRPQDLVSSPCVGIRPEGFAGRLECAFLNTAQGRLQVAADAVGAGFAQGKTMLWNRPFLNAAGGLPALARNLAEDVAATRVVRGAGGRVRLPPMPFAQPIGRRRLRAVWDRQLRWSRVRREGFPALFLLEPLNGAVLPALALALAAPGLLPAFLALWFGAEWWLARRAGWPAGPADVAAFVLRDLMVIPLWAATFAGRGFEWRGTAMAPAGSAAE